MIGVGLGTRLLVFHPMRLITAFAGIAVAVVIMFVELGLLVGLLDSQAMMATLVRGDLVIMSRGRTNLHKWNELDRIRNFQLGGVADVAEVVPVYQSTMGLGAPGKQSVRRIVVIAFPSDRDPLAIGDSTMIERELATPRTVLFDRLSRPVFGEVAPGSDVILNDQNFRVGGYVSIGPDIVNDGAVVMSEGTWLSLRPAAQPIMGVIRLKLGADVNQARARIVAALPNDVTVLTPDEVRSREIAFTLRSAPIGILFGIGMLAGLVIGAITCYQILFNEIVDRIKQYATLKAMGFTNAYLRRVILEQAILLSFGGFSIGVAAAWAVYRYLAKETALAVQLSTAASGLIFVLAAGMAVGASLLAVRRVRTADPAELY
mgnify:CR=1 FL=1|jgi:putative ABC transport system permease protein